MTKKSIFILTSLLAIVASSVIFILYSNDHLECDTITKTTVSKSGEKITTTEHVCKERFNF
jgi:hypothetical protein